MNIQLQDQKARPSKHCKTYEIIVNGREESHHEKRISFEEVVILAFGEISDNPYIVYTVTYKRGPRKNPQGSMVKGDSVRVKDGMVFNVTETDKS